MLALKENRLKLAYQPIVGAKIAQGRRITNACCAWSSPTAAIVTAGHFVPAAEQMGIVHLVDRFALEATVRQLKAPCRT